MAIKYRAKDIPVAGRTFQRLHGDTRQLLQALNQWMEQRPQLRDSYYPKDINSNETIDTVLSYDKKLAHFDRSSFMKIFFPLADHKKALFNSQGEVIAVAATFPLFHENDYKLEQVYADNFDLALMVLHALLQDVNATNFSLLTPDETENEQKFIDFLVKQANCSLIKQAHRSYSREFHCPIDWNRVFAMIGRGQIASPLA
uniref:Uncharacterized protein n=1 Tax=Plectus sambesii TaxID=2011161 RepID=A0A914WKS1_9BILA